MRTPSLHAAICTAALLLSACSSNSSTGTNTDGGQVSDDGGNVVVNAPGYLQTQGSKITDSKGTQVRLTGVSWFGMETQTFAPHGLDRRGLTSYLDQIKSLGFNMIRVPFCTQMFDSGSQPNGIDFTKSPELQGKKPIEILDELVKQAGNRGLRIILDRHRPDAYGQSNVWFTAQYSEQRWIDDWKMLATRYKGDPTVIGFDLHNEPHGQATWGDGSLTTDWRAAAVRAGNQVLGVNPDLLIVVEGIEQVNGKYYWQGGNLLAAGPMPVQLNVANRVVYSTHDYPATVYPQPWFGDPSYPTNLPGIWDSYWGYLSKQNIAPVWIGEFGTKDQMDSDKKWLTGLVQYIKDNQLNFAFWCWNPDSGDTGGILADDWQTVNTDKMMAIQSALAPLLPAR